MDVDLRKLRYFVAVAESGGFRRAAEELRIGQPALTRQIRAFEGEMDAELFTRSFRGAELTEAGRRLLAEAPMLLEAADSLRRRLGLVRRMTERVTLGFVQGIPVAPIARDFTAMHRKVDVDLLSIDADEQAQATVTGRVDVCFARLPLVAHGLEIVPLYEEPRVVALPSSNPIAQLEYVSLRDLQRFRLLQPPDGMVETVGRTGTRALARRGEFEPAGIRRAAHHEQQRVRPRGHPLGRRRTVDAVRHPPR
jgi:DNA-binding transcriptional LysR family regulator